MSGAGVSMLRYIMAGFVAVFAALVPFLLITLVLKSSDLIAVPHSLNPAADAYRSGIEQLSSTSDSLTTIALALAGATAIWFLKDRKLKLIPHTGLYLVFVSCVISFYFRMKLGYLAGLTLASGEPDISPLLALLRSQALVTLAGGLLLTAVVIFTQLTLDPQP